MAEAVRGLKVLEPDIVSISLGTPDPEDELEESIKGLADDGVWSCCSG